MNTHTGQKSRDLPQDAANGLVDADLAGLSASLSSSTRSGIGLGLGLGLIADRSTPEPWVRKLSDDGLSQYYYNTVNGETRWNLEGLADVTPTSEQPPPTNGTGRKRAGTTGTDPPKVVDRNVKRNTSQPLGLNPNSAPLVAISRARSGSGASQIRPLPRIGPTTLNRVSIHSDDSEIYPFDRERERERSVSQSSRDGSVSSSASAALSRSQSQSQAQSRGKGGGSPKGLQSVPEMTSAERLAQMLQKALAPPPPELVEDLMDVARSAIGQVLKRIHVDETPSLPDEPTMDKLIRDVVLAVRNLVYVAAVSPPQIPSSLVPRKARDRRHTTASQTLLKTPQRKVTATLAKLVLSARAMKYDSGAAGGSVVAVSPGLNTPARIQGDAEELDKTIVTFVSEVQRCIQLRVHGGPTMKRIQGTFSTANIGLGLVGGGVAGSWKGLGWVGMDGDEEAPGRILGTGVVTELDSLEEQVKEWFGKLYGALKVEAGE